MTTAIATRGRLYRRPDRGIGGGVAAGIAEHVGISTRLARLLFIGLTFAGGFGVALYGVFWIVLPTQPDAPRGRWPVWLEYVIGTAAALGAAAVLAFSVPFRGLFVPLLLAGLGGALLWRQASETERDRWRRVSRSSLSAGGAYRIGRIRIVAGAVLVLGGAALVLARTDFSALREALVAVIVTVVGVALITGPWWMRMVTQLGEERNERIRSQERAEIAAHLHDSVLQTLALIQRNAGSPREVARLARGQERELRVLLYGAREASGQLAATLRVIAGEVEDAYAVTVETVVVGDAVLDEDLAAATAAAREALVNAAKHAGVTSVSLYGEVEDTTVAIYVKDRGVGFDLEAVAADRQGVRGSIIARVERHGGTVNLRTGRNEGTEVEITMPRSPA